MLAAHVTHSLGSSSGVESYLITVADAMQRSGHDVWIASEELGASADLGERLGLRVARGADGLPHELDVAFVHSAIASHELAQARPDVAQIFVAHGRYFDNYVSPQVDNQVGAVVSLSGLGESRIAGAALPVRSARLCQPVDRTRFRDRAPIGKSPRRALILSNYLEGEPLDRLQKACELAGLSTRHVGASGEGLSARVEDEINAADIVFGKGRAVVEAMSCGRAAYVYDMWGSDGWVTPESYETLENRAFGGTATAGRPSAEAIAEDLQRYSPDLGTWGSDTAVLRHSVDDHVAQLAGLADEVCDVDPDFSAFTPERELARLARQSWRHEGQAHALSEQLKQKNLRIAELESQLLVMQTSRSWRITAPLRRLRRQNL